MLQVEIAMQWCSDSYTDNLVSFVNTVKTMDGGTHLEGFRGGLTRTMNAIAKKGNILKENEERLIGDFLREGLTAVISVKVRHPE